MTRQDLSSSLYTDGQERCTTLRARAVLSAGGQVTDPILAPLEGRSLDGRKWLYGDYSGLGKPCLQPKAVDLPYLEDMEG